MADLNWPDPSESPWTDPNEVVWEHNGIGWRKKSVSSLDHAETLLRDAADSHPAAAISGLSLPNMLLNADFLILDHGGGNRTPGINVYGFNRWRGSAIGLKQTVEGASITSGNYTLSWGGGTGNGSLNGVEAASPITTVLASDVNANAEVPSDATWARLEIGDNVSPHVRRDIGEDVLKCERFYEIGDTNSSGVFLSSRDTTNASSYTTNKVFKVVKRASPTIALTHAEQNRFPASSGSPGFITVRGFRETRAAVSTGTSGTFTSTFTADAEIYD